MSIFEGLRTLVYLRRIARAMERQADALDEIRTLARSAWQRKSRTSGRPTKMTDIQSLDIEGVNELWRREQEAASVGGIVED